MRCSRPSACTTGSASLAFVGSSGSGSAIRRQLQRSYDLGERNLAELQMVREHAALFEEEGNRETWRREELERRVEILEEENRNQRADALRGKTSAG